MLQRLNPQQQNVPLIGSEAQSSQALQNAPLAGTLQQAQPASAAAWLPSIRLDIRETPQEVIVAADLPESRRKASKPASMKTGCCKSVPRNGKNEVE